MWMKRPITSKTLLAWTVVKTRWPVRADCTAIWAVSASRTSPTMILSGSWRRIERKPRAKVSPFFSFTGTWVMPGIWYSTGSSMVMIASPEDKIITIEDPVEYQIPGITQVPVNEKKGLTFARGLRSILRHDPDKIMVGEVRDPETAQIAVQSALTGPLVFTTVHANNVFDVIGRFLHMGVEPYNFVSALNCIMAQRLVRLLCRSCRRPAEVSPTSLQESGLDPDLYQDQVFHDAPGCEECGGTGFRGRTAVAELLDMSDRIRQMILERRPTAEIKQAAREEGMTFLRESALEKVFVGATTLKEINKVTFVQ